MEEGGVVREGRRVGADPLPQEAHREYRGKHGPELRDDGPAA